MNRTHSSVAVLLSVCLVAAAGCSDDLPGAPTADGDPIVHAGDLDHDGIGVCDAAEVCATLGEFVCSSSGEARKCVLDAVTGCRVLGPALQCDDGLACNGQETCADGPGCVQGAVAAGCCSVDADCDDDNLCNGSAYCDPGSGTCVGSPPPDCVDANPCNGIETCDPAVGCVGGTPVECSDGNVCNGLETCDETVGCSPGVPLACDDDLVCNGLETCDPASGCVAGEVQPGCCSDVEDCEDGNVCNGWGTCDGATGTCVLVPFAGCDDDNICEGLRACVPETGCEVVVAAPTCSDGNPCNGEEACDPIVGCVSGEPLLCSDENACNGLETCDVLSGCVPGDLLDCDDHNPCNGLEVCDPTVGCVPSLPPACDDGDACNGHETCDPESGCVAGDPVVCAAGSTCEHGACVAACPPGWGDCDDAPDNGCEASLLTDPDTCGDCETACDAGQLCEDGACSDTCVANGLEACNGVDDDCDGDTDEDFDLQTSTVHCGGCGQTCQHPSVVSWACTDGACRTLTCVLGFEDANGVADDGCEEAITGDHVTWVAMGADALTADGTKESPYPTLLEAIDGANPGDTILVGPGIYPSDGHFVPATTTDLTIRGSGPDTVLTTTSSDASLHVVADGITLSDLALTGTVYGLRIGSVNELDDATVERLWIHDITAPPGYRAYGVRIEYALGLWMRDVWVDGVQAPPADPKEACDGPWWLSTAGDVEGITVEDCTECTLTDLHIQSVHGASGAGNVGCDSESAGRGANAMGLVVKYGAELVGSRITISDVRAGRGGDDHLGGAAGDGGDAYGLKTSTTMGCSLEHVVVDDIVAGAGGGEEGTPGDGGRAMGVDIHFGTYLTLDDLDVEGVEGGGADLTAAAGDAYGVRVEDPDTASLDTVRVNEVLAGAGGVAGDATGLELNLYGDATIERLDIQSVHGGDGVEGGGNATGLLVEDVDPLLWRHVIVASIHAGTLADAATAEAIGVLSDADAPATLRNLTCHDVSAPSGPAAGVAGEPGYSLLIVDSILSDAGDLCLRGASDNPETHLTATHSILHGCDAAVGHAVAHDTLDDDPQFVDAQQGDLRVQPGSPAVDAALAESGYCGEPDPNGCRANLGFFANTDDATTAPGATHCACDDDD